ncbi:Ig-like domain-containing protein [Achromobacter sp. NPDC058515]|uniref:Ig-like domain-containing protein n=1 Tax=Achromobacter sp. NPDC058515 TaxID=3346533 RepID=UPI003662066B
MKKMNWNSNFAALSDKRSFPVQPLHALKDTLRVPAFEGGKHLYAEAAGASLAADAAPTKAAPASAAAPAFGDLPIAVTHIVDDVSTSGEVRELGANAIVDDNLPVILGTGPAGAQLNILDGSTVIGSVTVGADGTWSFAPEIPFSEGGHILSARDAGSGAPPSSSFIFIVDTIAPGSTSIASVSENLLNPQGDQVPNGGPTKDNTPTLSGKSEPNSLVTIYNFGVPVASITSDVRTGAWSWTPMYPLPDGEYKFSARASDFVGNTGLSSKSYTIIVDTIPVPTARIAFVGITDDTGSSATDYITSDNTLLVRVEVDRALNPGEAVQVSMDNGASWSNAVQFGNHWVHDNTARALAEGERTLQARVVNTKGEAGPATSQDIVIDLAKPAHSVSITTYVDDAGESQGEFSFGAAPSTDDKSPLLKGTLDPALGNGERVAIYRDGEHLGFADVTGTTWKYQDAGLGDGRYVYTARVIDAAGNEGDDSDPATLVREDMLTLAATDTAVHEAALVNGTGIDWAANDGSTTSDRTAGGDFTLGGTVTEVAFRLGGEERTVSVGELARNPAYKLAGDTLEITSHGDGKYSYTYTLDTPKAHDTSGGAVGETVRNDLAITARDANGKSVSETGRVEIVNDELRASPGAFLVGDSRAPVAGVNLTLVLDRSASMEGTTNTPQGMQTKWDIQIKAIHDLLDKYADTYASGTAFHIDFVVFSTGVDYSQGFSSVEQAKSWLQTVGRPDFLSTTNYHAALTEAQKLIRQSFDVLPGWEQKVYFLTDGEPNEGEVPQAWVNFVKGPYKDLLEVYGVGIDAGATAASQYIKQALGPGDKYLSIADPADLAEALKNTVAIEGNLFGADVGLGYRQSIALGGDGGFTLLKVTVGGSEHVFGATPVTIVIQPGLSIQIAADGSFKVDSDGPLPDLPVAMTFDVVDGDGDRLTLGEILHLGKTSTLKIEAFVDEAGVERGVLGNGGKTDDVSPLLKGSLANSLQAGQRVDIHEDGRLVGTATVIGRDWSFQLEDVAAGKHSYTAVLVDGNGDGLEMSRQFLIDVNRDPQLAIDGIGDQAAAKTYAMADGSHWVFYASDEGKLLDYRLYARHFSADGKALGEPVAIAQGAAAGDRYIGYSGEKGQQYVANYDVSFKPDGSFMVAYATNGGDADLANGTGGKLYLSSFDATGDFIKDLAAGGPRLSQ